MSTQLPVTFKASPLPSKFKATPQQFLDAIVARLSIEAQDELTFFVSGPVAPSSNVGPWLKNGTTWYVWDNSTGQYIPEIVEFRSLRYVLSATAPDQAIYTVWIKLDGTGKALGVYTYSGGAWKDAYEDKFALYSTTVQMNAAINAASIFYPCKAKLGGSQTVPVDSNIHKLVYDTVVFDHQNCFTAATNRYVVPVAGIYEVTAHCQLTNATATASGVQATIALGVNGITGGGEVYGVVAIANPPGDRWFPSMAGQVQCAVGDVLEAYVVVEDGVLTGNVTAANGNFNIKLVQKL